MKYLLSLFFLSLILVSCGWKNNEPLTQKNDSGEASSGQDIEESPESNLSDRMDIARRRVALRTFIRKWDYYRARNDAEGAIRYYSDAFEKANTDPTLALKLASAHLETKKFSEAYRYFSLLDIRGLTESIKLQYISSFMLDAQRSDQAAILEKSNFEEGTKAYYRVVLACTKDFKTCSERIRAYTGNEPHISALAGILSTPLPPDADSSFQEALIAGKLFEQGSFLASFTLASSIVERRPDYQSVLKILGYSAFELGDYVTAAKSLEKVYTLSPKEMDIVYMLGVIHFYKEDYSTSNLYFNTAVLGGYTPKTELERRLIYNYTLLGDTRWAFKIFRYLLDEADATEEDYEIAIFIALESGETSKARLWCDKWIIRFPQSSKILAFSGEVRRLAGEYTEAEPFLAAALQIEEKSPLAHLMLGRLYIDKKEYTLSREHLEFVVGSDIGGFFSHQARSELLKIPVIPDPSPENTETPPSSP